MVAFFNEYTSKVDDKGRIVFPAPFKGMMPQGGDMRFVIKKNIFEPCLEMYTYEEWQKKADEVLSALDINFNRKHAQFWREYMRDTEMVEPDPKVGRISISRKLREAIGIDREVVFSGNGFRIEIWAKEKFEASRVSDEEIIAIAESLSNK